MTLSGVEAALHPHGLAVLGGFHPEPDEIGAARTLLMIGPDGARFWPVFSVSPEYFDGTPDALDRWSLRVLESAAEKLEARALFPFGGPPYHPFYGWAIRTGRFWPSPIRLLVHDTAGLMVSFRGALAIPAHLDLPETSVSPCDDCAMPCLSACPVDAFAMDEYDVPICKAHLMTRKGTNCMQGGCLARRACPVGQGDIPAEQAALSMRAFI